MTSSAEPSKHGGHHSTQHSQHKSVSAAGQGLALALLLAPFEGDVPEVVITREWGDVHLQTLLVVKLDHLLHQRRELRAASGPAAGHAQPGSACFVIVPDITRIPPILRAALTSI